MKTVLVTGGAGYVGRKIHAVMRPRREGDPAFAVADARVAKRTLRWSPRFTTLDEIVATAWSWMQWGRKKRAR